jgi:enoyl-CoA hydratase
MSEEMLIIEPVSDHPGVLMVTINRSPVNALSLELFRRLRDVFASVDQTHPDARAIVLTGAGRMFSAGADVKELSERTTEGQIARSVVSRGAFDAIRRCPLPVIAAVNGPAIGAGVVVASCADIILASETATFSLPEVLVGVMGGTRHMARMVPDKMVRYLALTGRKVDARDLERFGGIHEITAPEALLPAAIDLAAAIAANSPTTVALMKEAINLTEDMPLNEGYRVEQLFTTLASSMPDSKEAASAFLEKRKPVWSR